VCGVDPGSGYVDLAAELLKILAEPTRVRIVLALWRTPELSVNSLAQVVGKSGPGEPHHLAKLRMARMVATRQDGTRGLYRLADNHPSLLVEQAIKPRAVQSHDLQAVQRLVRGCR
ncbi:ArsR/SmtB family transcription factor, partial [Nesterenkonia aurantiaca]|uniref:ArsR/SmtB family transcription factor n=1 Tax=Nesterenkonia aurantiaca TaxID=1436010 RepID=UPI003EE75136